MADVRLSVFENFPVYPSVSQGTLLGVGSLHIQGLYVLGSISFNSIAAMISAQTSTNKTISISFGLYSLNGSTLSLANSASASFSLGTGSALSWVTLVTSTTQDITPGNWYFAAMSSTAGDSVFSFIRGGARGLAVAGEGGVYGGNFVRGYLSVSTSVMPASIATSDLLKEFSNSSVASTSYPYILISA